MGSRGRQSAAELTVTSVAPLEPVVRPDPPDEYALTDEQVSEWWAVVNRLPADWFPRETHALLAAYCRHVVSGRKVAQLIEQHERAEEFDVAAYNDLLKMQEREGRAMSALATKMRISQQATTTHRANKGGKGVRKPWDG